MHAFGGYQGKENCKTPPAWILHPGKKYKISEKRGKPRTQPSEKISLQRIIRQRFQISRSMTNRNGVRGAKGVELKKESKDNRVKCC